MLRSPSFFFWLSDVMLWLMQAIVSKLDDLGNIREDKTWISDLV